MALTPAPKDNQSGIALFMVIAAISVLSILVTEFASIAQMNKKIAYDGLDQLKAHYLAKSGLKLSLLRLKAYQTVKGVASGSGGKTAAIPGLPKQILEKIWSFPFFYPIPTNVPGISPLDKERIQKFQDSSSLDGKFSALIESESSKYNLNSVLSGFAAPAPSPSPTGVPTGGIVSPTPQPSFNPQEARDSLGKYFESIKLKKDEEDPEFAAEYRDWNLNDFMDNLLAWADFTYERHNPSAKDLLPLKRQPFYSLSELHMVPGMDDRLFALFGPALTVSKTPGINVNTIQTPTLKAILPQITEDEVKEFFKFRDDEEQDNSFKSQDEFFKWIQGNVAVFHNSESAVGEFKKDLTKRNIQIVTEESQFKIIVQATVNQSTRLIEAWVTLTPPKTKPAGTGAPTPPDSGLRITFMRIL